MDNAEFVKGTRGQQDDLPPDAKFVRSVRRKLDLTQIEFAEAIGLERRSIIRYEGGEELPKLVRLAIRAKLHEHEQQKKKKQKKKNGHPQVRSGGRRE